MSFVIYPYIDTSYMYIIAILIMVRIYNVRRPDLIVSEHMVFLVFAIIICLTVVGVVSKWHSNISQY